MLTNTTFLCGIDHIELAPTVRNGERFMDRYYITNDHSRIEEIIRPLAAHLGTLETRYLVDGGAKALIYRSSVEDVDENNPGSSLRKILIDDMLAIKQLQFNLWLLKDNAVNYDRAWIAARVGNTITFNNNVWESRYCLADGSYPEVRFETEELRAARGGARTPALHIHASDSPTMLTSGARRFQRFSYFVGMARSSSDLAMKIAQYCSGLEALVSTQQTELSHQVSERIAATIGKDGRQRIEIFKCVKEAYGFRSKAVHGAVFKAKDLDRLRECATDIDEVCRALSYAYLMPQSEFKEAVEGTDQMATDFFLQRLLNRDEIAQVGEEPAA